MLTDNEMTFCTDRQTNMTGRTAADLGIKLDNTDLTVTEKKTLTKLLDNNAVFLPLT